LDNHVQLLGVTYGFGSAKELEDAGAKVLVDKPEAIPAGLAKLAK
jgi:phosphoglycolate phosphatase